MKAPLELTRISPSNLQAEQMLLGAILTNSELFTHVNEFLKAEHFYELLHQNIYQAIEIVTDKGLTATPISLKSMLERNEAFIESGGIDYLGKLASLATMVINPKDYGKIIYELALKRDLIKIGEEIVNSAYESTLEKVASEQIQEAESALYKLATEGISEKGFVKFYEPVGISLSNINKAMKNDNHLVGISTGLIDLDEKLAGFQNSDLVIIAGRPSMGKTAFAISLAMSACRHLQNKDKDNIASVGFFSLEMSSEQLATRLLSMHTDIDSSALRSGKINEENYNKIRSVANEFTNLPFFIDDTPALSISAIRTRARKLKRKHNLGILFIDYLQLLKGSGSKENRVLEISEITQGLKAIAKELNIPVIALSQLSRAVESREDKRPMLSDLRESGSIEQDADIVMFIYREEYYMARKQPSPQDSKYAEWVSKLEEVHNIADIIIAKHRNGPIGNVQVFYHNSFSKFGNLKKLAHEKTNVR